MWQYIEQIKKVKTVREKKSFTKVISLQSNSVDFRVQIAVFELEVGFKKTV